ncbi:hypothetical protein A6V39_00160 [Candidatus Mycoplasma haematobovis]|uniref:Uncharacterized protein n=1 Tax=Candidatus Mycoplasma haematobovis TaxID=432608 RepID=A0A1A9QD02_9MOLU|nr:hypothetical protein [Candidatus Mycoplasma haematobovis]OAL10462.1 hypothetical protein A6V39_00160 [Candidatus Mycoplasma haematobovis]
MNLKTSLFALLGVSTVGGGVAGGYYLFKPDTNAIKQSSINQKDTVAIDSESGTSKDDLTALQPKTPASTTLQNQQSNSQAQLPSGGSPASPSNINPSPENAGTLTG